MTKDRSPGGRRRVSGDRSGGRRDTWFVLKEVVRSVYVHVTKFWEVKDERERRRVSHCSMTA